MFGTQALLALVVCGPPADGDSPPTESPPQAPTETGDGVEADGPPAPSADLDAILRRVEALEQENAALEERVEKENDALRQENEALRGQVETLEVQQEAVDQKVERVMPLAGRVGGYLDFGFFYVGGDGTGIRADSNFDYFPEYEDEIPPEWVFMGDPLSTVINSRGDPAETGDSRAVLQDSVSNGGKASFIVNALNVSLFAALGKNLTVDGLVDFLPRNRDVTDPDGVNLGDFVDIKLAYLRYKVPVKLFSLSLYAGKIDPVVGYEYRIQEAPDRLTVTPSLLCRYTCGRPVGIKSRWKFLRDRSLILNLSVTNGGSWTEQFGFQNEVDTNHLFTFAGRLSYAIPRTGMEIGGSGAWGAQDLQTRDDVAQWQWGVDLHVDIAGLNLTGEFIMAKATGNTPPGDLACADAPCLDAKGAYGLVGYRILNWLLPYARVDWRDALHRSGASFVYISELVRITGGIRFDINEFVLIKGEYTHNRELGRIPQFPNDVFTSSVVARF